MASPSNLQHLSLRLFAFILGLIGITLVIGGAWLISLGGSRYYLPAGLLLLASAVQFWRARISGFWLYAVAFGVTLIWAIWEVGFEPWPLVPRLFGPLVLLVLAALLSPQLDQQVGRRARIWGLTGAVGVAAVLAIVFAFFVGLPLAKPLPEQQASSTYDDPSALAAKEDWPLYGGGSSALRYSDLHQIGPENVAKLKVSWTYHTGELPKDKFGSELTPLKIGDTVFGCTGMNKMFALDAATGKPRWTFDPEVSETWLPYTAACRGVAYYRDPAAMPTAPCAERIIEGTLDMRLIAVDAKNGQRCAAFGTNGEADLKQGLAQRDTDDGPLTPVIPGTAAITAPPFIVQGVAVTGQQVLDGQRRWAASGVIRGYDAVTGELRFAWDVNQPEVTKLPPDGRPYSPGTPNSWTASVGDEKLGLVFVPMGNSAGDYYSGLRSDAEKAVSSALVALDVHTGKPRWVFQTVRDDVWDYDLGSQPSLVEFPTTNGKVPAIILPTKRGDIFVLDRATGKPLVSVEERPVPGGGAEPEQRSRTQPFSTYHTLQKPDVTEKAMWGLSPIDQMICRINFRRARYEGIFTPPELGRANLVYPSYNGGNDWGSVSIDPRRGVIIANYNDMMNYDQLITRDQADKEKLFPVGDPRADGSGGASAEGAGAQTGTPYAALVNAGWVMPTGVLCTQPPYGGIRAIELSTGKTLWDRPLGTARRNGPLGLPSFMPFEIGTPNNGGPVTTASGLVFIAAATDDLIRAIDMRTGDTLWSDELPGGGQATPMTYEEGGRQYVLIMAGGHHFMKTPGSDALVAYALPDGK